MFRIYSSGPAGLLSALFEQLGLGPMLEEKLSRKPWPGMLSPSKGIKGLIVNLFCSQRPFFQLDSFFEEMDLENLFGQGVSPGDFSWVKMALLLDYLGQESLEEIFFHLCSQVIRQENIPIDLLHCDTVNLSLCVNPGDGFSPGNQGRGGQESRRLLLAVSSTPDKVPLWGEVGEEYSCLLQRFNRGLNKRLKGFLSPGEFKGLTYVACPSLFREKDFSSLSGYEINYITRMPCSFPGEKDIVRRALEGEAFQEAGSFSSRKDAASYRVQSREEELWDETYHLVVVCSSRGDSRKARSLEKELQEKRQDLEKRVFAGEEMVFFREKEAREKLGQSITEMRNEYYLTRGKVIKKGYREQGNQGGLVYWGLKLEVLPDPGAIARAREALACYVLVTNLPFGYPAREIFKIYQGQTCLEPAFTFLPNPLMVDSLFIENPARRKALGYILMISLLLFSVLERRIREKLKAETEPLLVPGGKKTYRPTGKKILQGLQKMKVAIEGNACQRLFPRNLQVPSRIFRLAGVEPEVYLDVLEITAARREING